MSDMRVLGTRCSKKCGDVGQGERSRVGRGKREREKEN